MGPCSFEGHGRRVHASPLGDAGTQYLREGTKPPSPSACSVVHTHFRDLTLDNGTMCRNLHNSVGIRSDLRYLNSPNHFWICIKHTTLLYCSYKCLSWEATLFTLSLQMFHSRNVTRIQAYEGNKLSFTSFGEAKTFILRVSVPLVKDDVCFSEDYLVLAIANYFSFIH